MRSLYLRIWLTVVAVLALFALVSGLLLQRHVEQQRGRETKAPPKQISVLREHRAALEFPTSTLQPINMHGSRVTTAS